MDVSEVLQEAPLIGVVFDALLGQVYGLFGVDRGKHRCTVGISGHQFRVERCGVVEKRIKQPRVQRSHVLEIGLVESLNGNLAADILQRPHPIPVGEQAVGPKGVAFQPLTLEIEVGISVRVRQTYPVRRDVPAQEKDARETRGKNQECDQ